MKIKEMIKFYQKSGLNRTLASARVCQDIVLKAISESSLSRNITIKGGVVMRSLTNDNRRATRDIDLDFIHYSIEDESIKEFIRKLNCLPGFIINISKDITELKHEAYHGKSITIEIIDETGFTITSKMDIGVHKNMDIKQDEYCFDVCMDEEGVSLLKNTAEQVFAEKLYAILKFGPDNGRYKDIYDMFYLKDMVDIDVLREIIASLIFEDLKMRENNYDSICLRVSNTFSDKKYLQTISESYQRWMDNDIHDIAQGILEFLGNL